MQKLTDKTLSRRTFAQWAALVSTGAGMGTGSLMLPSIVSAQDSIQLPADFPKLSVAGQAEADARYQLALSRSASRLNEEQKHNVKLLCSLAQPGLERLRSFPLKNGDVPDLVLKPLVEREKPSPGTASKPAVAGSKKP